MVSARRLLAVVADRYSCSTCMLQDDLFSLVERDAEVLMFESY